MNIDLVSTGLGIDYCCSLWSWLKQWLPRLPIMQKFYVSLAPFLQHSFHNCRSVTGDEKSIVMVSIVLSWEGGREGERERKRERERGRGRKREIFRGSKIEIEVACDCCILNEANQRSSFFSFSTRKRWFRIELIAKKQKREEKINSCFFPCFKVTV